MQKTSVHPECPELLAGSQKDQAGEQSAPWTKPSPASEKARLSLCQLLSRGSKGPPSPTARGDASDTTAHAR